MEFRFEVLKTDPTGARLGRLTTPHGVIDTPAFMPVGTAATVKGLTQQTLEDLGVQILLPTRIIFTAPRTRIDRPNGGLHRFMSWPGAILTDSGGFQVFSLGGYCERSRDEGVMFRSHLDGSEHLLTPEKSIEIQQALGSDIAMVLDECIEYPVERVRTLPPRRGRRSGRGAAADYAREHAAAARIRAGVVWHRAGRAHTDLRRRVRAQLVELDFPGYAVGGLAVGEPHALTCEMAAAATAQLPAERPRYLMGVGLPEQIAGLRSVRHRHDGLRSADA